MKVSLLRNAVKRADVKPVNIRLMDGTLIKVNHPETCTIVAPPHPPPDEEEEGYVYVWEGEEAPYFFRLDAIAVVSQGKKRISASK